MMLVLTLLPSHKPASSCPSLGSHGVQLVSRGVRFHQLFFLTSVGTLLGQAVSQPVLLLSSVGQSGNP